MTDLTPPPDEPLPEQARARIRADLLAAAHGRGGGSRSRRWLVPSVAAAAVLLVAALSAWAVRLGDGGTDAGPTLTPSAEASESRSEDPTQDPSQDPTADATEDAPTPPGSVQQAGGADCRRELRYPLPGAVEVAGAQGWVSFWVAGDRYAVCAQAPGRTTIHRPLPLTPAGDDPATYAVSTNYLEHDGQLRQIRVAGGILPDGVTGITYRFPTGDPVPAQTVVDGQGRTWWFVRSDVPAPAGNEMNSPSIEVVVSLSGVQRTYELDWAAHTCAQVNHGC